MPDPSTIAGKALWLRAKDLGTGAVTSWSDQSGKGNNVTGSGGTVSTGATPSGGKSLSGTSMGYTPASKILPLVNVTATANDTNAGLVPANAFDGDSSTAWESVLLPGWIQAQLPSAVVHTSYQITPRTGWLGRAPKDFTFQGSNDGSSWTTLDTRTGITFSTTAAQSFSFSNSTAYSYYRLNITAVGDSGSVINIAELGFDGASNAVLDGEIWIVLKTNGGSGPQSWKYGTSGNANHYTYGGDVYEDFGSGTRRSFTPSLSPASWRLYRVRVEGTNWTAYIDNTSQLTTSSNTASWNAGPSAEKVLDTFSGEVAEILIVNQALSSGDAADLITYFNTEHGLSVSGGSSGITGTVAATGPTPTTAITGTVPITGAVAATGPVPTAAIVGNVPVTYPGAVAADSPLLYWRFEETSGTTAADSSGNGKTGTYSGSPTLGVAGVISSGLACSLNGSNQYIFGAASETSMSTTQFSAEAWFQTTSSSAMYVGMRQIGSGAGGRWRITVNNTAGKVKVQNDDTLASVTSTTTVTDGARHHVVLVQDATTLYLYVDGVLEGSTASTAATASGNGQVFAGSNNVSSFTFNGKLDEFAVYGTALSSTRVTAHYNAGISGDITGAVAATGPVPSVSITGTVAILGSVSAVGPQPTTSIVGAIPVTGIVAAVGPVPQVSISDGGTRTGSVAAVGPRPTADIVGSVATLGLEPWSADLSRRTLFPLVGSSRFEGTPALVSAPTGLTERALYRESKIVPVVAVDSNGRAQVNDAVYDAYPLTEAISEVGVLHVIVDGQDVTYFRNSRTLVMSYRIEQPFGDVEARFDFPMVSALEQYGTGDLSWLDTGKRVDVVLLAPGGGITNLWSGKLVANDGGNDQRTPKTSWSAQGTLWEASTFLHRAPTILDPTDIGRLIPKCLNGVVSRTYPAISAVSTGVTTKDRGTWSETELAYCQRLLATAWNTSGSQVTVRKVAGTARQYEVGWKDVTTVHATVTFGSRGVECDLTDDDSERTNVIFGQGIRPDGYWWGNTFYPGFDPDSAPAYPFTSSSNVISVGGNDTDAETDSGSGVSTWQRRAVQLGYTITVDGVYSSADATACRAIQRRYGLLVDGIVGPQTWAATFDVGAAGGDLNSTIRLPLAADPATQKYLYNANGSIAGANPAYDKTVQPRERYIDYGTDVYKRDSVESAQKDIDRSAGPNLQGRVVLYVDPREMSRFLITPGMNLKVLGYNNRDPLLHIASVEVDPQALSVTLEVDEQARDAMTLAEIRERNKESRRDPARKPGNPSRRAGLDQNVATPFDGESPAGVVPRFALYGGLWSVVRIPVSQVGHIAKIEIRTETPASEFALLLFGEEVKPAHLVSNIGNPLSQSKPWMDAETFLDAYGFIEGWGTSDDPGGYSPGRKSDGDPLTGWMKQSGVDYVSEKPPWVWCAFYSPRSCFVQGHIYPAPIQ